MKNYFLLFIVLFISLYSISFAQELEVQGDLKVQGNVDATNNRVTNIADPVNDKDAVNKNFLRNSVQDNGPWEYKLILVEITKADGSQNGNYFTYTAKYRQIGDQDYSDDFQTYLNTLGAQGWYIDKMIDITEFQWGDNHVYYSSVANIQFILKRKITE